MKTKPAKSLLFIKNQAASAFACGRLVSLTMSMGYCPAFLAAYIILSAEQRLSSCLTSVIIPILASSSALIDTCISWRSASLKDSRSAAMKSRMSLVVLKESLSWILDSVPYWL